MYERSDSKEAHQRRYLNFYVSESINASDEEMTLQHNSAAVVEKLLPPLCMTLAESLPQRAI
jgi:hypothetical protein